MNNQNKFGAFIIFFLFVTQIFPQDQNAISKSFTGFNQLKIQTGSSDFSLKPSNDSLIHIKYNFTYNSDEYHPKIDSNKNTILVDDSFFTSHEGGNAFWEIEAPKKMEINFSGQTSSLSIEGLDVDLIGETSTGSFQISKSCGTFNLTTSTGKINLNESKGSLYAVTSTGTLNINKSEISINSKSTTGVVKISATKGDEVIKSETGNIYSEECRGNFELTSSTGSIDLKKIEGKLNCISETGNIYIENPLLKSNAVFSTTTGNTGLYLNGSPEHNIDINTYSGNVELICPPKFNNVKIEMVVDDSVGVIQSDLNIGKVIENYKTSENASIENPKQRFIKKIINPEISEPSIKIVTVKGKIKIKAKD